MTPHISVEEEDLVLLSLPHQLVRQDSFVSEDDVLETLEEVSPEHAAEGADAQRSLVRILEEEGEEGCENGMVRGEDGRPPAATRDLMSSEAAGEMGAASGDGVFAVQTRYRSIHGELSHSAFVVESDL